MPKSNSPPAKEFPPRNRFRLVVFAVLIGLPFALAGLVFADWYRTIPTDAKATYVGRQSCISCHQQQHDAWHGSHHDLAMDLASGETVLGNFDDAELEHFGVTSRMFQREGKYFVHTEGEGGQFKDYEVKWVFGVEPLQQYLVELERPDGAEAHEIGRVQVLPVAWDTTRNEWFYIDPPDVHEKLEPGDRLHWTGTAQNWNRMCADCHSTNLQKNFNPKTGQYHTTFTDIDVSCETCHGPGSLHVQLAERASLFWDRERGYALPKLNGKDHTTQVETCARCHVRRSRVVAPNYEGGEPFYDYFCNALIREGAYHADGQILDEVYVHGSFIQSKMYHKGVRCSDCHDPHSTKVKFEDNRLCTSCHTQAHSAGKFDTPAHHHHKIDSKGSFCIECHMPETTYMEVDPRRDHSLRVPRPDLSVKHGTPNACTGCHLDASKLSEKARDAFAISHTRNPLEDYASWLRVAAEAPDDKIRKEVQAEIDRVNAWALEQTRAWYGKKTEQKPHYASALAAAWQGLPKAEEELRKIVLDETQPAMARASALAHLVPFQNEETAAIVEKALSDEDPLVRFAALGFYEQQINSLAQAIRDADLEALQANREAEGMERAAAEMEFHNPQTKAFMQQRISQIRGRAGQARGHAAQAAEHLERAAKVPAGLLDDPVRLVRVEAGRILAPVDGQLINGRQRRLREVAIEEYIAGLMDQNDWAMSHHALGLLYQRMADEPEEFEKAIAAYRQAIAVEEDVTGPRSNLAQLLLRLAEQETDEGKMQQLHLQARELQREEAHWLGHEAKLMPHNAFVQYRYAAALVGIEEYDKASEVLTELHKTEPGWLEPVVQLIVIHRARDRWDEAVALAEEFASENPQHEGAQIILNEIRRAAVQWKARQRP